MFDKIPQPIVFQEFQKNGKRVDMGQCRDSRKKTERVLSLYQRILRSQNSSTELCSKGSKEGLKSLQYLMLASRSDLSVQLTVILALLNALLRFKKVSRIEAESQDGNTFCQLVIIRELYSVHPNELYRMVISEVDKENPDESDFAGYLPEGKQKSPADQFEFIMQGKVYNVSTDTSGSDTKAVVHISFGGLQFMLKSDPAKLQRFKRGQRVLLLMTKV
ncbi:PREDICTED: DNA-directed RNA polymerases II and V subunit 8A-like isoform X1 [Nicotiana attenuata]|uniref:Dna-directed rna polymerases ii and v subunit 8a n=1 Tax=Nicotiana attenuata TaxID=49451 RepID=A0A314KYD1_NICAT|nr:PREDICTED: DNA-directed RNA polymerases II and V subunit 8A-like isoform X1 [Nicotiana attenuata]OIT34165.1 dna-directed rna polymerases ii and v subunit 8a [Nicotiana attenuata]